MSKLMLLSFSGLSDHDANGMTLKALLSAWKPEELCQFYCGPQEPDFSAASSYFRVTDMQMMKSFFGKKFRRVFRAGDRPAVGEQPQSEKEHKTAPLPGFLKRRNQNFAFRMLREFLWSVAPWGRRKLMDWAREEKPDALLYMVGDSFFMDRLAVKVADKLGIPLILYNCEAYRLVDTKKRRGLDRLHHTIIKKQYRKLNKKADHTIFNCPYLQGCYEKAFPVGSSMIAYNSSSLDVSPYVPGEKVKLAYFGNLGIGRVDALLDVARVLQKLDASLTIDVYGSSRSGDEQKLQEMKNIHYHGFVDQEKLRKVKEEADILLHAESFDPEIIPKLEYAFSTKIAQCLCAGRSFLSYAPQGLASTQYLLLEGCAVVATSYEELEEKLGCLVKSGEQRVHYARQARQTAQKNHCREATAAQVRQRIEAVIHEK